MYKPSTFPKEKRPPTIFNQIEVEVVKRAERGEKVIALHIGDAHLPLPEQLLTPVADEDARYGSGLNRYGDAFGDLALREILLKKVRNKNNLPVGEVDFIQVTGGATGALQAGFSRLLGPGKDVLTLAPYWSILRVVADQARVNLIEVPCFDKLGSDSRFNIFDQLEKYLTANSAGIYINTPSNPTGIVLSAEQLEMIADFARKHDLWVFSDEAYEDFIYDGSQHVSIGSLPGMFKHTLSVYSISKCFGASGLRIGYVAAPPTVVSEIHRGVVGSHYQAGRYDMRMAWRGMLNFENVVNTFQPDYAEIWRWVRNNIRAATLPCVSGFYFFVKLSSSFDDLTPEQKVFKMLDAGVALSPGEYFGDAYKSWARLCFTVVAADDVKEGIDKLNDLIG